MKKLLWSPLALGVLLASPPSYAQTAATRTLTGTVVGSNDQQPLPGVNVLVKGTTQGTQTDSDGRYSLANVPEGSTLAPNREVIALLNPNPETTQVDLLFTRSDGQPAVTQSFGRGGAPPPGPDAPVAALTQGKELANGPQLPGSGTSQAEVDRLLASFD